MTHENPVSLRIVLVHRYFRPDTPPYASILAAIAARLAAEGHAVTVLTCQPSYGSTERAPATEHVDGYQVVRWPVIDDRRSSFRKLLNAVLFSLRLLRPGQHWRNVDVVMAATTPPVVIALVCSLIARSRGGRFVYHKQDIWPEVSSTKTSFVTALLQRLDATTDRRAWRVVTLSEDMADTTRRRSGDRQVDVEVLNNFDPWELDEADSQLAARRGLCVVYAGNLGRFQGLEHLVDVVASTVEVDGIEWHFFGEGPLRREIDALAETSDVVHVHGHRPPEEVAAFVRRHADLGCVSLNEGVIRAAYPSKVMTYLRHGLPIFALVEPDSEMGRMIGTEDIGVAVRQLDLAAAVEELGKLATDPERLVAMRARARSVYERRFAPTGALESWSAILGGR